MKEIKIPIKGIHCKSCTVLIADELNKIPGVTNAKVDLDSSVATIKISGSEPTKAELNRAIKAAGYDYSLGYDEKTIFNKDKNIYGIFILNIVILGIIFWVVESIGLTNLKFNGLGNGGFMALIIGLTAGFSTCMALVGGLVLGLSARFAEKHKTATIAQRFRPHLFFNLGRILSFSILGGLIGLFGSVFKIDSTMMGLLTIAVGFVMIVLGLQLTELFPRLSGKSLTLPVGLMKLFGIKNHGSKEYSHKNAMILGGLTFFLPCGFTQAMQLLAISSGNFITGATIMGLFAIGTAPGLLGVGGLVSAIKGKFAKNFFRFAGAAVVLMAIYNISNGWILTGYNLDLNFNIPSSNNVVIDKNATILSTTFTLSGDIAQKSFEVIAGKPYVLEVDAKDDGQGCMSTIMIPGLYNNPILITKGKVLLPFTANKPGTYKITCAMGIVRGSINVVLGE